MKVTINQSKEETSFTFHSLELGTVFRFKALNGEFSPYYMKVAKGEYDNGDSRYIDWGNAVVLTEITGKNFTPPFHLSRFDQDCLCYLPESVEVIITE